MITNKKPKEILSGIFWHYDRKLYQVFALRPKNQTFQLGFYNTLDEAKDARNKEYSSYAKSKQAVR